MKKRNNKKGFTLAELLIVVAIIAVLVAIAIPIFTSQLEKSREATDIANVRAAYAEVVTSYLTTNDAATMDVKAQQKKAGWQGESGKVVVQSGGQQTEKTFSATTGTYTVQINSNGAFSVTAGN